MNAFIDNVQNLILDVRNENNSLIEFYELLDDDEIIEYYDDGHVTIGNKLYTFQNK